MSKFEITPRKLSVLIGLLAIVFFVLTYSWFGNVFRGDVILNQNIINIKLEYLNLFGLKLPFTDFSIRFYSVLILLSFACGYILALFLVNRSPLPNTLIDRLIIGIVLFGLIGARLFFVLFNLSIYFANSVDIGTFLQAFGRIFLVYEGGLAISGGIIGVVLYLLWFAKKHKFKFLEIGDILAPALLLGQIIGRFGNFFNYEAYGSPTNVYWKMFVPENAVNANKYSYVEELARYFHPTFLYEIIPNIILLLVILFLYDKLVRRSSGLIVGVYLIGYGCIRFITEFFRLDALKIPFRLSLPFPNWIAQAVGSLFPVGIKEPLIYGLKNYVFEGFLVSQVIAFAMIIIGVFLYKKRAYVIYSPALQKDLN